MFALRASTAYLIFCAHQKGVAVKNARGRSSARGAENEVWHGSKFYLELSSKAFSNCGQNLCKSCHSTPFRCSILSVEFNIKVHCRQLQIIGVANTCFRPIFLTRS